MRKTKIIGVSLPPQLHQQLREILNETQQTQSEFIRALLQNYLQQKQTPAATNPAREKVSETDLAQILYDYWTLRGKIKKKTLIIALGIIVHQGQVLIGARKEKDPWVDYLSWVFPGGRVRSLEFEKELQEKIVNETGLEVEVKNLVSARIHPDSGFKPVQIVALYFHCQPRGEVHIRPGEDLTKLRWVKPAAVFQYFTTSTNDEVTRFLLSIEKSLPAKA